MNNEIFEKIQYHKKTHQFNGSMALSNVKEETIVKEKKNNLYPVDQ
jgi:hypothetical protein